MACICIRSGRVCFWLALNAGPRCLTPLHHGKPASPHPYPAFTSLQTSRSHLQLYALNVSSEALWRLPDSQELRRVNVFLSHSIHLDFGAVRIADLGGDAKSLLVALSNGTMQVFSWQGKVGDGPMGRRRRATAGSRDRLPTLQLPGCSVGALLLPTACSCRV